MVILEERLMIHPLFCIKMELLFGCEEERMNRIRFSEAKMPENSIRKCLEYCDIKITDIDYIAFPQNTWGEFFIKRIRKFFEYKFGHCPQIKIYNHHLAHAASTYYNSGYEDALIMTADGSGDSISTSIYAVKMGKIENLKNFCFPNSFGLYYSIITQFLGFEKNADEYKLMGLSGYGVPNIDFSDILKFENGEYQINIDIVNKNALELGYPLHITKQDQYYSDWLSQKLQCKPRKSNEPITQKHMDIASSAQKRFEEVILKMLSIYIKQTGIKNICLAGGTFMNCLLNGKIYKLKEAGNIFVPPVCDDSGTAMGAAILCMKENGFNIKPIESAYYGEEYTDEEVVNELKQCSVHFIDHGENIYSHVAYELAKGKIIGWFQGRMEVGPRALGNRSILADPRDSAMKDKLNLIKKRNDFQPFGPSVIDKVKNEFFDIEKKCSDNFMTVTFDTKEKHKDKIPAAVHVDGSARVQVVSKRNNPRYYRLLQEFEQKTGYPVLINTSLNRKGEPIARTINDALAILYSTSLEGLAIGTCLIMK